MTIDRELDELFTGRRAPTIGELFDVISKLTRDRKVSITFTQNADGFEYRIEPWEPYQPKCPYSRAGENK